MKNIEPLIIRESDLTISYEEACKNIQYDITTHKIPLEKYVKFNDEDKTITLLKSVQFSAILFPSFFTDISKVKARHAEDRQTRYKSKSSRTGAALGNKLYNIYYNNASNCRPSDINDLYEEKYSKTLDTQLQEDLNTIKALNISPKPSLLKDREFSTPIELTANLLKNNNGIAIGEKHEAIAPKKFIMDNIEELKHQGVSTIYLEHLFKDDHQDLLDEWHRNPSSPMPNELKLYLQNLDRGYEIIDNEPYNFLGLVDSIHKAGIRIVGIDDSITYIRGDSYMDCYSGKRYLLMNKNTHEIVNSQIDESGKYIVFVGGMHLGTRKEPLSLPSNKREDIPGVDQLLSIPSVVIIEESHIKNITITANADNDEIKSDYLIQSPPMKNSKQLLQEQKELLAKQEKEAYNKRLRKYEKIMIDSPGHFAPAAELKKHIEPQYYSEFLRSYYKIISFDKDIDRTLNDDWIKSLLSDMKPEEFSKHLTELTTSNIPLLHFTEIIKIALEIRDQKNFSKEVRGEISKILYEYLAKSYIPESNYTDAPEFYKLLFSDILKDAPMFLLKYDFIPEQFKYKNLYGDQYSKETTHKNRITKKIAELFPQSDDSVLAKIDTLKNFYLNKKNNGEIITQLDGLKEQFNKIMENHISTPNETTLNNNVDLFKNKLDLVVQECNKDIQKAQRKENIINILVGATIIGLLFLGYRFFSNKTLYSESLIAVKNITKGFEDIKQTPILNLITMGDLQSFQKTLTSPPSPNPTINIEPQTPRAPPFSPNQRT